MSRTVSNAALDEIAEGLIASYAQNKPGAVQIDIESFITDALGLPICYVSMAEQDKDKLGFLSDGKTPLSVYEDNQIQQVTYPVHTIVLDRYLTRRQELGRKRFTLAHEVGHILLDRMEVTGGTSQFHRDYDSEAKYHLNAYYERFNVIEMQANRLAATLLMPRFLVEKTLYRFTDGHFLKIFGDNVLRKKEHRLLTEMATCLGVSFTALLIRLKQLGFLEYRPMEEYLAEELRIGLRKTNGGAAVAP